MSISLPKNGDFIRKCKNIAEKYDTSTSFNGSVRCYYDASPYSKRDYCLEFTTRSNSVPYGLKEELKKAGAVNIIGRVRKAIARNYVDIAFNMKASTAEFKSYDDLSYHLRHYGLSPEILLRDWFEQKIKILIAGKNVSYTDVIHNCLKDKMQDLYIKKILEEENEKQKNLKEKFEDEHMFGRSRGRGLKMKDNSWKSNNTLIKVYERRRKSPISAEGHLTFESPEETSEVLGYLRTVQDNLGFEAYDLSPVDLVIKFVSSDIDQDEMEFLNMIDMATGLYPDEYNFTYVDEDN